MKRRRRRGEELRPRHTRQVTTYDAHWHAPLAPTTADVGLRADGSGHLGGRYH